MYVAQDMPEMAAKRTLFFEEPVGDGTVIPSAADGGCHVGERL